MRSHRLFEWGDIWCPAEFETDLIVELERAFAKPLPASRPYRVSVSRSWRIGHWHDELNVLGRTAQWRYLARVVVRDDLIRFESVIIDCEARELPCVPEDRSGHRDRLAQRRRGPHEVVGSDIRRRDGQVSVQVDIDVARAAEHRDH